MFSVKIALRLNANQFSKLIALANHVYASLNGNVNFTTTSPTLLAYRAAIDATVAAFTKWGTVGQRGSHADYIDLLSQSRNLFDLTKAMAEYVQNTAILAAGSDMVLLRNILITSGFELVRDRIVHPVLEQVVNFRVAERGSLNRNQVRFRWKRPANALTAGYVRIYEVYRSATSVFSDAELLGTTTRAEFIDTNDTAATVNWNYWVLGSNSAGRGAVSEPIAVMLVSM